MAEDQVWMLREHRVEASGSFSHRVRWYVDGRLVAETTKPEGRITLEHEGEKLTVRFSGLGQPRRATLGDADLVPAPGSPAAAYERGVLEHPTRYAVVATLGGVAKVVVPLLLGLVAVRFAVHLPFPDLPSIPTPDLPSIPWPDLPDFRMPAWLSWLLDKAHYVWPVVLAFVLARAEIRRRREQDRRRRTGTDRA